MAKLNISFEEFCQHVDRLVKSKYEKRMTDLKAEIETLKNELFTVRNNHENVLRIASEFLQNAAEDETPNDPREDSRLCAVDPTIYDEDDNMSIKMADSENSDFSDWIDEEDDQELTPPKRSKKKQVELRTYAPSSPENNNVVVKKKVPKNVKLIQNGEMLDEYKPPQWISEVMPTTNCIQMGDEVVYIRQAHEQYIEYVKKNNIYELTGNFEPWRQLDLKDHEFCKVIGIKYEVCPPRFYSLKLAILTEDGLMTNNHFSIRYTEVPDIKDFILMKRDFDDAMEIKWKKGDRFRSLYIDGNSEDNYWWFGRIISHEALSSEFPNSPFMCLKIKWDERYADMCSPWDIKPVDRKKMPKIPGDPVKVHPKELLYQPGRDEWLRDDRKKHRKIVDIIDQVMSLDIAEPFLKPVDLTVYPIYAYVVEYPIDLTTIRSRVQNHYYRQITAAQFDVRYLATNAEKFYKKHSKVVKNARIVTDVMLKVLSVKGGIDVKATVNQLNECYMSSDDENYENS